jgi:Bax protein
MLDRLKLNQIPALSCLLICCFLPHASQAQSWRPDWNNSYYPPYPYLMPPSYTPYTGYNPQYAPAPNYYPFSYQQPQIQQQGSASEKDKTQPESSNAESKKAKFVQRILPIVQKENQRLIRLRYQVINLVILLNRGYQLKPEDAKLMESLAKRYKLKDDPLQDPGSREELLNKIDIIPNSLALAQAANESAWGQSRFSREANNLFGIWTFDKRKGLKPRERDDDKNHLVRKFEHVDESIRYYMLTLNSHPAYRKMRKIRKQLRENNMPITGEALVSGLEKYSSLGNEYVQLIQNLIEQNKWAQLDTRV